MTPHITHIVGTLKAGGAQKLVLELAKSELLSSYEHSVICVFGLVGEFLEDLQRMGIKILYCPFAWPDSLPLPSYRLSRWLRQRLTVTFPYRLEKSLQYLQTDLVHTHITSHIHLQASGIVRRARLPWVWMLHGMYGPEGKNLLEWQRAVEFARQRKWAMLAVADAIRNDVISRGIVDSTKIGVVGGGVDIAPFFNAISDPAWRESFGIPRNAILFGASGRLSEVKGYDIFIKAAQIVVEKGHSVYFVVAGSGNLLSDLNKLVVEANLKERFQFIGYQSDIPHFLKQIDVFVMPSRSEGFPLALIEALGSGLPCIATDVGGIREILGSDGGIIVLPERASLLAEAMEQMLSRERRQFYSANSQSLAKQKSIDKFIQAMASIYANLLE